MPLEALPVDYAATRAAVRRIGAHVMARARHAAVRRIDLAAFPGGIGTPSFGDDHCVIRLCGDLLIVERTGESATTRSMVVNAASLANLADLAGADLTQNLDVGHDTPPLGDIDEPITVSAASVAVLGKWFAFGQQVIDRVVAGLPPSAAPSRVRIWPEHFDLGIDIAAAGGTRLNLGASPGDEFHEAPYIYVSPWDAARPGDAEYWNAPFGAVVGYDALSDAPSAIAIAAGVDFMREGIRRLD